MRTLKWLAGVIAAGLLVYLPFYQNRLMSKVMDKADINHDGIVSEQEWIRVYEKLNLEPQLEQPGANLSILEQLTYLGR